MKKKIGFFVPEIKNCGPVNVVFNIISFLNTELFDVQLIAVRKNNLGYEKIIQDKCSLGVVYMNNYLSKKLFFEEINTLDIVHSHCYLPDKYIKFISNNVRKITTIHNLFFKDYIKEYGPMKGLVGAIMHFYHLKKNQFDAIVGCSQSIEHYLSKFINKTTLTYVCNGVNQNIFKPLSKEQKNKARKGLGFTDSEKILIFAGRFIRRKRVPELITLFNEKLFNNSKLLLLGSGEEEAICKEKAKGNPNILFLGFSNTPEKYYQIADYVISASSAEGYPMSILEAVSCGCYAYLSDIPSHREFLSNNPSCGDLIENISENNILENRNTNFYNLSAQKMADEYTKIYLGEK
ncbi:glycosyltransferase family 4 protein [Capnocytophaga ochracea]|uniref:GDP-mannose-dependent alpha-(1-6)-phosphatidylinositol monomannoside mannosyltransferase n=1 Tax=Capnocytophaga ochracea TaxID=1018 RepID=A0A2X2UUN8_CAPOC|nr:glycosyltransferase family 4 protein [Capnocytophaga ochracea]SQA93199.1 GDP-mannose-dependent alpha-(1-6)-phosphatidylinositol monomannoside mannosyltransferase [Capnocytophaga ochracea]